MTISKINEKLGLTPKYCKITLDAKKKKLVDFGVHWGAMPKVKANATFVTTGNGWYAIDIDFKNVKEAPTHIKKFIEDLGTPTIMTARGAHYYIKSDAPMTNHQNIFDNKDWGCDIRGQGGLLFQSYDGGVENISYTPTGKVIKDKDFKIFKSLPKDIREPKKRKAYEGEDEIGEYSKKQIKKMLSKVDIMDYTDRDAWITMIASIYKGGGDKVKSIAQKWCKGDKDQYDDFSFQNIWWQVSTLRYGTDITVGTLKKASGNVKPPEDTFRDMTEDVKIRKKELSKKDKVEKANFNVMSTGLGLTKEKSEALKNQKHLFDGIVVDQMHTVLFGVSGSQKTTLMAWMMVDILKRYEEKTIHVWEFDANNSHISAMFKYAEEESVVDRFELIVGETANKFYDFYNKAIKFESDMSNIIVVIDVLKVFGDVNSKSAMATFMHYIKQLQGCGATVLTLAHANKNADTAGKAIASGTADVEQSSDALLVINRKVDDNTGVVTTTVEGSGRVRFNCAGYVFKSKPTGTDYEYLLSSLQTMKLTIETIADNEESASPTQEPKTISKNDTEIVKDIASIIDSLNENKKVQAKEHLILQEASQSTKKSQTKIADLLREFVGVHWTYKQKALSKKDKKKNKVYVNI